MAYILYKPRHDSVLLSTSSKFPNVQTHSATLVPESWAFKIWCIYHLHLVYFHTGTDAQVSMTVCPGKRDNMPQIHYYSVWLPPLGKLLAVFLQESYSIVNKKSFFEICKSFHPFAINISHSFPTFSINGVVHKTETNWAQTQIL